MRCDYACRTDSHLMARRQFLGTLTGGAVVGGLGALAHPVLGEQLQQQDMRVLVVYMAGGLSQLESWDPKPKTDTGGPFRAISTAVPGTELCELLPLTATHMDKLSLIRGINTHNNDHGKGSHQMLRGRNEMPGMVFPHLGAVCARALDQAGNPLPGHIRIPGGGRGSDAAYLGPKYNSIGVNGDPPANSARPDSLTALVDQQRHDFRRRMNDRFAMKRRTAETDIYTQSYEQALQLMERRSVFDVSQEPASEQARYGNFDLGKHCLMARRLLEAGVSFVQVTHSNYDTHNENFNFHLEQLGEFDQAFGTLVGDLHDRGLLSRTLVVVMSEFGRTPKINPWYGRDHWGSAWSICIGGAKVQPGAVIGKTNENGTAVVDREVDHGNLFHTYLSALGVDSSSTFDIGGREVPLADPARGPIQELIA